MMGYSQRDAFSLFIGLTLGLLTMIWIYWPDVNWLGMLGLFLGFIMGQALILAYVAWRDL